MTKVEKIKFAYLVSYVVLLIVGIVLFAIFKHTNAGKVILIIDIVFGVLGGVGFVILHHLITKYHCHHCGKDFKSNLLDTIMGEDKGVNVGKKTVCRSCGTKDYYKAVRNKDGI